MNLQTGAILRQEAHLLIKPLFALVLAAAVPSEAYAMDILKLNGRWVLEAVNGKAISSDQEIYFQIVGDVISGYDGCNTFGGKVTRPFVGRASKRGCAGEVLLPLDLADPLAQLDQAIIKQNKLFLPLPNSKGDAQFRRDS
jgi:hypothetical protein